MAALVGQVEDERLLVAVVLVEVEGAVPRVGDAGLRRAACGCCPTARGDSTLMTSAPISASSFVAYGPAHIMVRSATRMPSSGRFFMAAVPSSHSFDDRGRCPRPVRAGGRGGCHPRPGERSSRHRRHAGRRLDRRPRGRARPGWPTPSRSAGVSATPIGTLNLRPMAISSSIVWLQGEHVDLGRQLLGVLEAVGADRGTARRSARGRPWPRTGSAPGAARRRSRPSRRRRGRCPTRRGSGCPCAAAPGRRTAVDGAVQLERAGRALLQRDVDPVALAVEHRTEVGGGRGGEGVETAEVLRLAAARHERLTVEVAGQRHDAAHGEAHDVRGLVVAVGAGLAERRDRHDDERRLVGAQLGRGQTEAARRPGAPSSTRMSAASTSCPQVDAGGVDAALAGDAGSVSSSAVSGGPSSSPRPAPRRHRSRRAACGERGGDAARRARPRGRPRAGLRRLPHAPTQSASRAAAALMPDGRRASRGPARREERLHGAEDGRRSSSMACATLPLQRSDRRSSQRWLSLATPNS